MAVCLKVKPAKPGKAALDRNIEGWESWETMGGPKHALHILAYLSIASYIFIPHESRVIVFRLVFRRASGKAVGQLERFHGSDQGPFALLGFAAL